MTFQIPTLLISQTRTLRGHFKHITYWSFQTHCILVISNTLHTGHFKHIAYWSFQTHCILVISNTLHTVLVISNTLQTDHLKHITYQVISNMHITYSAFGSRFLNLLRRPMHEQLNIMLIPTWTFSDISQTWRVFHTDIFTQRFVMHRHFLLDN